ncbi:MAG TPA: DUF4388 domain-containing protein [Polyangiaceae bacterium]|jgi:hypothetical protein
MTRGISERDVARVTLPEGRLASGERSAIRRANELRSEGADAEQGGFSGTCQNTSLADWVQLIQMGRRDALIVVRTPDHGEGRLWCQGGDIIDACWGRFTGEEAVYRILAFESGDVSVDFTAFDRPRAIRTSTAGLLLEAAYRKDTRVSDTPARRAQEAAYGAAGGASHSTAPTVTGPPSLPPLLGRSRSRRTLFWAAATAIAAVAFWFSWRSGSNAPAAASSGLVAPTATANDLPVYVEAQPEEAEIRLDGQLVAKRALTTSLPRDGRLHEVIVSARGYVPELVTFRDRALTEHISLARLPAAAADPPPERTDDTVSSGARHAQLTHRAPSPLQDAKNGAAPSPAPPAITTAPAGTTALKAKIQTIEERQPRIQAIDEGRPRIESIE